MRQVRCAAEVAEATEQIRRESARVFAPRFVVVKVVDGSWQELVQALARSAAVVVIDVSDPSVNLEW